jgi:two-component system cell cycle sensor histidine kinase/response regulator CckA
MRPDVFNHMPRILIVDDERPNRQLLEVILQPEGFFVQSAANGKEALALVAEQPPDLILLDIMMPDMDGYEVARKIKDDPATRNIPIIMITALNDRSARLQGLSAGAADFLAKPVDRAELCVRVKNLLRLKAYGDYHDRYSQMLESEVTSRTAQIVESEDLYRSTFDASPVGLVHVGLDGQWLRVNQRICDFLGYSREELLKAGSQKLLHSEVLAGEAESIQRLVEGTLERQVFENKGYRRKDGTVLWARVNISVRRDGAGQARNFIVVIEDIAERRTLEAQIRQTSKMESIGRLAAGVAHDFNNLLSVILGFTQLAMADVVTESKHGRHLHEIEKAGKRAANLTSQLLAFSRQQVLNPVPLNVNVLVTGMGGMIGMLIGKQIEIELTLAPDLPETLVDRGQLEQVLMNLVVNARDAMPKGGKITIETKTVELENSFFHHEAVVPGNYVMVAVTDTGSGMTRETLGRLFEPFFTTKAAGEGTGLGLSTTYGIIKQSQGHIWVYSELGLGTTFKVYLPRAIEAVINEAPQLAAIAPATRSFQTILVVDDEAGLREFVKDVLVEAGYEVFVAADGADAERVFARHADSIDAVVTDVTMPVCSGPELIRRLQIQSPGLKVLYMSGYPERSALQAMINQGLPFIQKPFTVAVLLQGMSGALAARQTPR